jgi:hypothetical protein
MASETSRRLMFILVEILTLLAGYIAIILLVIATGAPLSDVPRHRLSECDRHARLRCCSERGFATWWRWRASNRTARRAPG